MLSLPKDFTEVVGTYYSAQVWVKQDIGTVFRREALTGIL